MGKPWMWRYTILSLALNLLAKTMVQVARWAALLRRRALNHLAARAEEDKEGGELSCSENALPNCSRRLKFWGDCTNRAPRGVIGCASDS